MPWVRYWSDTKCGSCAVSEEDPAHETYVWYDRDLSEAEIESEAEAIVPEWVKGDRGYEYGGRVISVLPEKVRQKLLREFQGRKAYSEKMIKLLEQQESEANET